MKFLCDHCKAKYQIADDKVAGRTVRMKCRKCGNQIEVRAAVTETSVNTHLPVDPGREATGAPAGKPASLPGAAGAPPRPGVKPAPPRAGGLASTFTTKPAPPRPALGGTKAPPEGALAGAFQRTVQKDEEISVALDLRELSAADEWYVAINGVPVGPVRVAEVRRKAALGVVTEESLAWQEGMEEWRPVRAVSELAAAVREAASGGRVSLLSPPLQEGRSSAPPAAARSASNRPSPSASPGRAPMGSQASGASAASGPSKGGSPAHGPMQAAARSNVVPFASRLATAERLDEDATVVAASAPASAPFPPPAALLSADPFAIPPPPPPAATGTTPVPPPAATPSLSAPIFLPERRKGPPWIPIAMLVLAAAFGITAAILILSKPPAIPAPQIVTVPVPVAQTTAAAVRTDVTPAPTDSVASAADAGPVKPGGAVAMHSTGGNASHGTNPGATPNPDLQNLIQGAGSGPSTGPAQGSAGSGGPALTESQVTSVIYSRSAGVKRTCWERASSNINSANVEVKITVAASGAVQSASATGNDPVVTHCIESAVRGWQFPPSGGTSTITVPFHFLRQ